MGITFKNLFDYTERNLRRSLGLEKLLEARAGMSIDFPGYSRMKPGDFRTSWFSTVFLDIRGSTARAFQIGPQKTFATVNALLPTLARIVDEHEGFVVDYPGDGIMAHWELEDNHDVMTVKNCIQACCWMDDAVKTIINPLLEKYSIPSIICGIGAAAGEVVVTKIGFPGYMSAKAIGNSVNLAA
jgi:adenylate cyclase